MRIRDHDVGKGPVSCHEMLFAGATFPRYLVGMQVDDEECEELFMKFHDGKCENEEGQAATLLERQPLIPQVGNGLVRIKMAR